MKIPLCLRRRLCWLNVPSTIVIALLQRTPALKLMPLSSEMVIASPLATVLRSAFVGVAVFGIHTIAGATELASSQGNPANASVGTPITIAFSIDGTFSPPESWTTDGNVPPGLSFSGQNSSVLVLSGTPTTAGSYVIMLQAFNADPPLATQTYTYTINVAASGGFTASAITTQPQSQSVTVGDSVTFTVAASGNPTPTYQWRKNGTNLNGATNATLTLTNVQTGDAGIYTVVATNSAGSATSNGAVLTVSTATVAPAFTTQPASQTLAAGSSATFNVVATGNPAPTYQWRKNGTNLSGATTVTLTLSNVQARDAATYTVVATNSAGSATSNGAVLTVSAAAPIITAQPQSQVVAPSTALNLSVTVTGQGPFTYQWYKDGSAIAGATAASYAVGSVTTANAGSYTVVVTSGQSSLTSVPATVVVGIPQSGRLANLSVRALAGADAQTLIVGFIVGGGSKQVLLRGLGPTLALPPFNVAGTLGDPKLQIFGSSPNLPSNENWGDNNASSTLTAVFNAAGAYLLDPASKDAALQTTLPSGGYTAWITGALGTSGIALAEIFDTEGANAAGRLANISARAQVGTGDSILIVGFIISGNTPKQVLIRAIGPTLAGAPYNVPGVLADPKLELYPGGASTPSVTNDNWADNGAASTLSAAFTLTGAGALNDPTSKDAAMLVTLQPGSYTALVSGVNGATGVALVELFEMP